MKCKVGLVWLLATVAVFAAGGAEAQTCRKKCMNDFDAAANACGPLTMDNMPIHTACLNRATNKLNACGQACASASASTPSPANSTAKPPPKPPATGGGFKEITPSTTTSPGFKEITPSTTTSPGFKQIGPSERQGHEVCTLRVASRSSKNMGIALQPNAVRYDIELENTCSKSIMATLMLGSGGTQLLEVPARGRRATFCTDYLDVNKNCHGFTDVQWREP